MDGGLLGFFHFVLIFTEPFLRCSEASNPEIVYDLPEKQVPLFPIPTNAGLVSSSILSF